MLCDRRVQAQVRAHVHDVADFLIQHRGRQAEGRYVGAHQSAGDRVLLENRDLIAQGQQVVGDGERGGPRAYARNAAAVPDLRGARQQRTDVVSMIRRDALQPADGHGLVFDPPAPAGGLARPVADSPKDAREHVGRPIHHVGVGELALGDQPDVFRNIGVCRAGPLAVDHFVEIIRLAGIGRFHVSSIDFAPKAYESIGAG